MRKLLFFTVNILANISLGTAFLNKSYGKVSLLKEDGQKLKGISKVSNPSIRYQRELIQPELSSIIALSVIRGGSTTSSSAVLETKNDKSRIGLRELKKKLQYFNQMAWPYFQESQNGRKLFLGMIVLILVNSAVSVLFSFIMRDFWSILTKRDAKQFQSILAKAFAFAIGITPLGVYYKYLKEKLALSWREWMTDRTLQLYYANRVYYNLERKEGEGDDLIDNPDQRITEDVSSFTTFSLTLFITIITSFIDLAAFSAILFSIQPQLFAAIIFYATFGTIMSTKIGRKLVGLNFAQFQREADFRYSLVRIRENAESIAFYGGEDIEGKEVSSRLAKIVENKKKLINTTFRLNLFTTFYTYIVQILPIAVVAPRYFKGLIEVGVIHQSVAAFNHILKDLSIIVNQFSELSTFTAGIDRLYQFMLAIKNADPQRTSSSSLMGISSTNATKEEPAQAMNGDSIAVEDSNLETAVNGDDSMLASTIRLVQTEQAKDSFEYPSNQIVCINKLHLLTPDRQRLLIKDLSIQLQQDENLLIMGDSGAGKSSLLRAIAGLWNAGSGSIIRPSDSDVYFLPQRPYCALGSLKDQLLYPSLEEMNGDDYPEGHKLSRAHLLRQSLKDEDLLKVLEEVNLKDLPYQFGNGDPIQGLSAVRDWSNTLSLGEQQRLAFGRLLVNKPRLVILDEATSALDIASEEKMYNLLRNQVHNGHHVTYISVGHRPSLMNFHEKKLQLGDEIYYEPISK